MLVVAVVVMMASLCFAALPLTEAWPSATWPGGTIPFVEDGILGREAFDDLVRNGSAFVVRNTARASGLWGWTCETLQADPDFFGAEAQLSYGVGPDGSVPLSAEWQLQVQPTHARKFDDQAPQAGSLYFGIKDIQFDDANPPQSWRPQMLAKIQAHTRVPGYMDPRNLVRANPEGLSELDSLYSSPELWLSPPLAGAQAHIDGHISTTMSLQLSGRKRWRLSQIPLHKTVVRQSLYSDGSIYRHKTGWAPQYDFVLEKGDALFFPPGTVHETTNVAENCALSITYQFSIPMPSRYYRAMLRRFRRCGDVSESWSLMARWAEFAGDASAAEMNATLSSQDAVAFADLDGDGFISEDERMSVDDALLSATMTREDL